MNKMDIYTLFDDGCNEVVGSYKTLQGAQRKVIEVFAIPNFIYNPEDLEPLDTATINEFKKAMEGEEWNIDNMSDIKNIMKRSCDDYMIYHTILDE